MRRLVHVVRLIDLGSTLIKIGPIYRSYPGGRVLLQDIGKFVYEVDGVLQVENESQLNRRNGLTK